VCNWAGRQGQSKFLKYCASLKELVGQSKTIWCQLTLVMLCSLVCLHMTIWQCRIWFGSTCSGSVCSGLALHTRRWRDIHKQHTYAKETLSCIRVNAVCILNRTVL
jgi:hypothetical protein